MPDIVKIRSLPSASDLSDGDYAAIDNSTDGLRKVALGGIISDLKSDLSELNSEMFSFYAVSPSTSATGWKLKPDGYSIADSSYKLDKYQVTSGDYLKIVSDNYWQFQSASAVPSSGTLHKVGDTEGTGTFLVTVPDTATYLIVSTLTSGSNAAVYDVHRKIEDIEETLTDITTATPEDAGKMLKVKTVSNGKVTEWEFGEAGDIVQARLNATTEVGTTGSPQLFNKDAYTVRDYGTSYNYYTNCYIDFAQNGKYYINPLGGANIIKAYPCDANGNNLSLDGNANGYFQWDTYYVVERLDDTHVICYKYSSKSNYEAGITSGISTYLIGGTIAKLKFEFFRNRNYGDSVEFGIVYGKPLSYYVPYGINIKYRKEMCDEVWDEFVADNKFYNIPANCLNPRMQRSYALTDNLIDDRIFDWAKTISSGSNTYRPMKNGEVVYVTGGRTIICNKRLYDVKTYDVNGVETTLSSIISENIPYVLANDIVSIRFNVGIGANSYQVPANAYEPIYLYYTDALYPYDDVDRIPIPMAQINGWDINKNVYDMAIPDVTSNIVRMMKTFAIREINHRQNALRIGTFNLYINNTRTNRPTVKKELETYGIDICAFQEARNLDGNNQLNIGDYLKGWQFKYCNTNDGLSSNGRALASAYEVLSSTEVVFTANTSNSYLKCVIQLPRYKDYADGLTTLSLYTYHGNVTSADTRNAEVTQMLTDIATDTSDFIIVTGDTNDFSTNKDIWAMFNTAGLTPVHDGSSETVTERNNSLDNIFISSHCSCIYYDVINSGEWTYIPAGGSTPIPVSDHDLVYADIVFDFEAVIEARNN